MEPPMNPIGRNLVFAMYRTNSQHLKNAIDDFGGRRLGDYFIRMTTANQVYDFKNHTFTTLDKAGATSSTLFGKSGDARTMEQHRITHDFMIHSFARMAATLYPDHPNQAEHVKKYLIDKFHDKNPDNQYLLQRLKTQYPSECSAYNGKIITEGMPVKLQSFFDKLLNQRGKSFKTAEEKQAAKAKRCADAVNEAIRVCNEQTRPHLNAFRQHLNNFIKDCRSKFAGRFTFLLEACKKIDEKLGESPLKGLFSRFVEEVRPDRRSITLTRDTDFLFEYMAQYHESLIQVLSQIAPWDNKSKHFVEFISLCGEYLEKCYQPSYEVYQLRQECNRQVLEIQMKGGLEPTRLKPFYPIVPELVAAFKNVAQGKPVVPPPPVPPASSLPVVVCPMDSTSTGRFLLFEIYRNHSDLLKTACNAFEGRRLSDYFSRMTTADQVYDFDSHTFTTVDKAGATSSTLFGKTGEAKIFEQFRITHDFMIHSFARMAATLYPNHPSLAEQVKNYLIEKFHDKKPHHQDFLQRLKTKYPECSAYNGKVITKGWTAKLQSLFDKLLKQQGKTFKCTEEKRAAQNSQERRPS